MQFDIIQTYAKITSFVKAQKYTPLNGRVSKKIWEPIRKAPRIWLWPNWTKATFIWFWLAEPWCFTAGQRTELSWHLTLLCFVESFKDLVVSVTVTDVRWKNSALVSPQVFLSTEPTNCSWRHCPLRLSEMGRPRENKVSESLDTSLQNVMFTFLQFIFKLRTLHSSSNRIFWNCFP